MPYYMIDLDGTMFHGNRIIEDAKCFLDDCIEKDIPFLFLTNNASRTSAEVCEHMQKMGYVNIRPEHFYTAAMAAADTVASQSCKRKAFAIGQNGLLEALQNKGFIWDDKNPDFVFVGMDKTGSYQKYSEAVRFLINGAELVGTNNDRILLTEEGANIGNGSVVAMLEYCTGKTSWKIGKPHPAILEAALNYVHVDRSEVCIIGDNLETDILCGIQGHVDTIFVTTGVHDADDCDKLNIHPNKIVHSLKQLIDHK